MRGVAIEDEHGEAVGRLWYADREAGDVFLYAIELDESARGRGYGREAMQAFSDCAHVGDAASRIVGPLTVWLPRGKE